MMININKNKGFSLAELMIVVGIVGILGFVAYPSYQDFIRTGNRADVMGQLVELTLEMDQFKSSRNSYLGGCFWWWRYRYTRSKSSNGIG